MGGHEAFARMLDSVFVVPPVYDDSYYGFRIHEITEMQVANMGNYAHGNQPAQHMIYLYNYAGQPWKAQWWTREVMDRLYSARPDGYCGDEDNGQTSAWYVFSALGFYPVCPPRTSTLSARPSSRGRPSRWRTARSWSSRPKETALPAATSPRPSSTGSPTGTTSSAIRSWNGGAAALHDVRRARHHARNGRGGRSLLVQPRRLSIICR